MTTADLTQVLAVEEICEVTVRYKNYEVVFPAATLRVDALVRGGEELPLYSGLVEHQPDEIYAMRMTLTAIPGASSSTEGIMLSRIVE